MCLACFPFPIFDYVTLFWKISSQILQKFTKLLRVQPRIMVKKLKYFFVFELNIWSISMINTIKHLEFFNNQKEMKQIYWNKCLWILSEPSTMSMYLQIWNSITLVAVMTKIIFSPKTLFLNSRKENSCFFPICFF